MFRQTLTSFLLAVLLCFLLAGCSTNPAGNSPQVGVQNTDPLERDWQPQDIVQPSQWKAQGRDQAGNQWEGYLVIERAPGNYMNAGYFEWRCGIAGGRYHAVGAYDPGDRIVRWSGYSIEHREGGPCMAVYEARLSHDGRRLEDGRWSGGISIPGTFTAELVAE